MALHIAQDGEDELLSAINTTPLVDVMLVLLIIFLITVPVVTHTVPVQLPQERNQPTQTAPRNINISVDAQGNIYWNQDKLAGLYALQQKLLAVSGNVPQPEVHIWGDQNAHYQAVGEVLLASQRAGIQKVGFILQPPAGGGD
ncbi:MAG: ExbD/TolR family protein [Acidocella sp.]|uniref:ExbD/TolR family protein n=1 Tax=Acidocella sp. TaxID=50710 RepID=UPI003FC67E34